MLKLTKSIIAAALVTMIFAIPAFADDTTYKVKDGDTVQTIAQSNGISAESIIIKNKLAPTPLAAGQTIIIPSRDDRTIKTPSRGEYIRQDVPTTAVTVSSKRDKIVSYAKQFLGRPYVYGSRGPQSFDCSGFTGYIFKQYGVSLNRTAAGQASNGKTIARSELLAGDLLLFHTTRSGISHAGMYIGNGQFIHASSGGGRVMISSLSDGYYNSRLVVAKRLLS